MTSCQVCEVRTYKTREPYAATCGRCGKQVCERHIHFYVDESNEAITRSAPAQCADCAGLVTARCGYGWCRYVVEHWDDREAYRLLNLHGEMHRNPKEQSA